MSNINIRRGQSGMPLLAYKNNGTALLNFTKGGSAGAAGSPATHTESLANVDETSNASKPWAPWGPSDDFPKRVTQLMRKSTVGRAGLHLLTKAIYGQRLFTFKVNGFDDNGNEIMKPVIEPEWELIKRRSNFNAVRLALNQDYNYFGICFPELRMNGNKTKVWGIDFQKASHCRLELMDKNGFINNVYVSGNFPDTKAEDCQKIPRIDFIRYYDQLEAIRSDLKSFKYIMPQYWPDAINDYYPVVYWDSSRESGWLDIATSIPAYKKALFKNQMSLKYDIQIPYEYLTNMYTNFAALSEDEQDKIVDDLYDEIVTNLTGADNAQKALMSFYSTDKQSGKPMGQWIIKTIDDKMKNDAYLPDAAAANSEILFSMLVNPATFGQGNTGGDYTGGANNGGSNIRESGLDLRSRLQADRDLTNSYFNFIKEYNGWDPELQLGVQDMVLTTLDKGKGTEKVVS